ncbi:MAG: 50S ribosomal protein L13 [Deltaproteobacteria bacterium]|nr:50S ribosomal protein L13 [Deltaproteobacteria bacterium]
MKITQSYTKDNANRKWYIINLEGQALGRAASKIAKILRGKNKPNFTSHEDTGDFVVAINAKSIGLTGNKWKDKKYYHYTQHIGGLKEYTAEELRQRKPEELLYRAVKGMLPKSALGHRQIKKLKIYKDTEHPHEAQQPEKLDLNNIK